MTYGVGPSAMQLSAFHPLNHVMQKLTHLNSDWQRWTQENLARGCTTASLIDTMIKDNFNPVFAADTVHRVAANRVPQEPEAAPFAPGEAGAYVYEAARLPPACNVVHCASSSGAPPRSTR